MKSWLPDNYTEMSSAHNEAKPVIAKRFIRTLKNKIYRYMISISKNVYVDKLDDVVNEYNDTYYRTIKMKPVDVKSNTCLDCGIKTNGKDPKFKLGGHVLRSIYKDIFSKVYGPNWSEEVYVIKKVEDTAPWTSVLEDLNGEEIVETFYERKVKKDKSNKV